MRIISKSKALLLMALLILSGCNGCKKDLNNPSELPEATQTGRNIVGFKVNGTIWVPSSSCGFGQNPCGAIEMNYNQPNAPQFYINFGMSKSKDPNSSFYLNSIAESTTVSSLGNKYDSINIHYDDYSNGLNSFLNHKDGRGEFIITKLDFTNQIIAGTFAFTLYNGLDSIIISDGRFDCKFRTCACGNYNQYQINP